VLLIQLDLPAFSACFLRLLDKNNMPSTTETTSQAPEEAKFWTKVESPGNGQVQEKEEQAQR